MSKIVSHYVCSVCGRVEDQLLDVCPSCQKSGTFERSVYEGNIGSVAYRRERRSYPSVGNINSEPLKKLSEIKIFENVRFSTGLSEFDRVLGGGIMKGSSVLLGGEPGIGKSTLLLETISNISKDHSVVYISGEETASQVKSRAERLGVDTESINIFTSTRLSSIVDLLWRERPDVIVVDSLQTLATSDIDSPQGSSSQIKACTSSLTETIKLLGTTAFLVAHITKEGTIAGPKLAEHLVDTVLYFESAEGLLRTVRAQKNRYGSSDEVGVFIMGEKGLSCVSDPSLAFAVEREGDLPPGIVNTAVIEGTRAIFVELQVLSTPSKGQNRRIYSDKVDTSVVQRVVAILENQANINLGMSDIYVNVGGGMHLTDPQIELALAAAIYTSYTGISLKAKAVFFGELTLIGEIRKAQFIQKRVRVSSSMGYNIGVYKGVSEDEEDESDVHHIEISTLKDLKKIIDELSK